MTLATQQVTTMDEVTLAALKESIAHWEQNLAAEYPDNVTIGASNCALCGVFLTSNCAGCPVNAVTNGNNCLGKPSSYIGAVSAFYSWRDAVEYKKPNRAEKDAAWRAAAQAEIDFLRSLLPKEDKP